LNRQFSGQLQPLVRLLAVENASVPRPRVLNSACQSFDG
jgi:hypothetical protein